MAKLGPDHPSTLTSMGNLAEGYRAAGKLDLALPLFEEGAARVEMQRFQHEHAAGFVRSLIACHEKLNQYDQAENWRRKWLAVVKERSGADSLPYASELAALGRNLLQQKKWNDAETVLRECLVVRQKKQPNVWSTFNTQSALGGALLAQARSASKGGKGGDAESLARAAGLYGEAEPLLLKGYEGMKEREKTIPKVGEPRIGEAVDRLIELYTATNKPNEVKTWQAVRAKYPDTKPDAKK
jgi:tetratricopeptide (TPR) repeat protein